jgi:hypothetical protein
MVCIDYLSLGIGKGRPLEPLPPGWIQEIDIPVLGLLGHQFHLDAVPGEMLQGVGAVGVAQASGVSGFASPTSYMGIASEKPV